MVAQGDDFFDRTRELEECWRSLEITSVFLVGSRRVGKTSFLRKVWADAKTHGFDSVYVDLSPCRDELALVQQLYTASLQRDEGSILWRSIGNSWLRKVLKRLPAIGPSGLSIEFRPDGLSWNRLGDALPEVLSNSGRQWLIMLDEMGVFLDRLASQPLDGRARAEQFLFWLRQVRLQYENIRWVISGERVLDTILSDLPGLGAFNDLRMVQLGAYDASTADELLQALCSTHEVVLSSVVRKLILRRVGWLAPYYLQLVFSELRNVEGPVTQTQVDRVIDALTTPPIFDSWRDRLSSLRGADFEWALMILNRLCVAPAGISQSALSQALPLSITNPVEREEKLNSLLDLLQKEGYIHRSAGLWKFLSPLLRQYWQRHVAPPFAAPSRGESWRLIRLQLKNFRCFENLQLDFARNSTLSGNWACLAGINGAGKSSVLQAICVAFLAESATELGGGLLARMLRSQFRPVTESQEKAKPPAQIPIGLVEDSTTAGAAEDQRRKAGTNRADSRMMRARAMAAVLRRRKAELAPVVVA